MNSCIFISSVLSHFLAWSLLELRLSLMQSWSLNWAMHALNPTESSRLTYYLFLSRLRIAWLWNRFLLDSDYLFLSMIWDIFCFSIFLLHICALYLPIWIEYSWPRFFELYLVTDAGVLSTSLDISLRSCADLIIGMSFSTSTSASLCVDVFA